jgi:hypothetical protein
MTVVSSKEFATNQPKYYNLAVNEDVVIRRGGKMFHLIYKPVVKSNIPQQPILEPDDDLRRAITLDEMRKKVHKRIHELFTDK